MARRRKKSKSEGGDGCGALVLGALFVVGYGIVEFFKYLGNNIFLAILFGLVVIAIVAWVISYKRKKRAEYLRWFYDRNRRINELNANKFMNVDLTNAIAQAASDGSTIAFGKENDAFNKVKEAYSRTMQSRKIIQDDDALSAEDSGRALVAANGIKAQTDPMILRYEGENNGGYVFYVFPEAVLVFVEGPEKAAFIAAYNPAALSLSCSGVRYDLRPVVVEEKSKNPIRYYDRYCPVKDAEIVSSHWEVANKDGSRSFRGGLKPENNPLHFTVRYGELTVTFGDYSVETTFSYYAAACALEKAYGKFIGA